MQHAWNKIEASWVAQNFKSSRQHLWQVFFKVQNAWNNKFQSSKPNSDQFFCWGAKCFTFHKFTKFQTKSLTSCFLKVQKCLKQVSSFVSFERWIQILWPPRKNLIRPPIFHISKNNAQILNGVLNLVQLGTFFLKSLFAKIPPKLVKNFNKIDNRTHWRTWVGYGK